MNELGNKLKQAREAKGLSLDDLQTLTKIQKRYLQGIEEGNYSMMPGKFYVRAFIKQYSEAVGIDHEELFESFKADIPPAHDEEINETISRVQTKKAIPAGSSKMLDLLPKILIGVFIIGAIALFYMFAQKSAGDEDKQEMANGNQAVTIDEESEELKKNEEAKETAANDEKKANEDKKTKEKSQKDKEKEEDKKQEEVATQALAVVSAQGSETTYELKNTDKFELMVATTGETWINILNGKGTSFFQGMLKKGATESQTVDFSKETEAIIVVGRSSDTEIYVNGQKLEYAVPPTEEVRQDITIRYVLTSQ
ncbi:helix-turn-helix domain-containing protein [Bacillus marasmi]|uniref:helix-turn-helix domain-containing protein n=1 Tax=Bacillus marasmi TaxID=1926279 RepID=UPI0011CC085C|nr:RodZ domain-containing protein [Bacillus marasmi]